MNGLSPHALAEENPAMDQQADAKDVAASKAGDAEAYRRLVQRHQPGIFRRMRRFARANSTAEELVQDVFVEAYFSLGTFSGRAPFEHWLNRIATRVGYAFLKRQSKLAKVAGNPAILESLPAPQAADPDDAAESLHAVLDRLSPRDRLVVTLIYLENRTVKQTADLTGWSQTMVKVQAFRARSRLKKLLQEQP
jgi:RNA polymerase sigma-70 factor (ECF subfamily)